jgi:hypothetical protein
MLTLMNSLGHNSYEKQRLCIMDFYLLFPFEMTHAAFPMKHLSKKKILRPLANRYDHIENPKRLFQRLQGYQEAALESLASYNLIDSSELRDKNIVKRTSLALPEALASLITQSQQRHAVELGVMKEVFQELTLTGPKGLKQRTELFESRYDVLPTHFSN